MRLFIATHVPVGVRVDRSKFPRASWVRPESQHLTFAFLGEQEESVVDRIRIEPGPPFEARLQGCGFFPDRRRPRVGWVGVEPAERFLDLAHRVREGLHGIDFDAKPFKPHLTLVRMRDPWPLDAIALFEQELRDYSAAFIVDRVTLYASQLNPNGAVHTPLKTWGLLPPTHTGPSLRSG